MRRASNRSSAVCSDGGIGGARLAYGDGSSGAVDPRAETDGELRLRGAAERRVDGVEAESAPVLELDRAAAFGMAEQARRRQHLDLRRSSDRRALRRNSGRLGWDHADPTREGAEEHRVSDRRVERTVDGDRLVARLVAVADRAQPHRVGVDDRDTTVEADEIGRCHQPTRTGADHEAVEAIAIVHRIVADVGHHRSARPH